MSEDVTRYQVPPLDPDVVYAPGVRALQAGYEEAEHWRGVWEARAMTRATERDETLRENSHLWAALLDMLTPELRHIICTLAQLTPAGGWVTQAALDSATEFRTWRAGELPRRLIEVRFDGTTFVSAYRLTPFGARVADAIQGEG